MKKMKQLLAVVAFALAFSFVFMSTQDVEAAVSKRQAGVVYVNPPSDGAGNIVWKSVNKMRLEDGYSSSFNVYFGNEGDYITDVKANKKGLIAGVTYQYSGYWSDEYDYNCYGTISLVAQKAGNYNVTFTVRKEDGTAIGTYKMKVYCTDDTYLFKSIKVGSSTIYKSQTKRKGTTYTTKSESNYRLSTKASSAKLSITPNKGYKITGIVVVYRDANGVPKTQKTKNNRSIKLTQQYDTRYYYSDGTTNLKTSMSTQVFVSYKDKYLGTSVKYSVAKKSGVKMIKCVEKHLDGTSTTTYTPISYAGGNLSFWRY